MTNTNINKKNSINFLKKTLGTKTKGMFETFYRIIEILFRRVIKLKSKSFKKKPTTSLEFLKMGS